MMYLKTIFSRHPIQLENQIKSHISPKNCVNRFSFSTLLSFSILKLYFEMVSSCSNLHKNWVLFPQQSKSCILYLERKSESIWRGNHNTMTMEKRSCRQPNQCFYPDLNQLLIMVSNFSTEQQLSGREIKSITSTPVFNWYLFYIRPKNDR